MWQVFTEHHLPTPPTHPQGEQHPAGTVVSRIGWSSTGVLHAKKIVLERRECLESFGCPSENRDCVFSFYLSEVKDAVLILLYTEHTKWDLKQAHLCTCCFLVVIKYLTRSHLSGEEGLFTVWKCITHNGGEGIAAGSWGSQSCSIPGQATQGRQKVELSDLRDASSDSPFPLRIHLEPSLCWGWSTETHEPVGPQHRSWEPWLVGKGESKSLGLWRNKRRCLKHRMWKQANICTWSLKIPTQWPGWQ